MKKSSVLYEVGVHWVRDSGKNFEVYRICVNHSSRVAIIGYGPAPDLGIERAKAECHRREALEQERGQYK